MALRRWKPFYPAFGAIDTAIESATTEGCPRDKYRQVRSELVEMLCDCDNDDGARAEALCRLLDRAMAEALVTLRAVPVPVPVTPAMLAGTDVAKAVDGLLKHEAGMVRALARGVLAQWRASIEAEAPVTQDLQADNKQAAKVSDECAKNERDAKRKHPGPGAGGYHQEGEADDVKRQRKVPEMVVEHRPRKDERRFSTSRRHRRV